MAGKTHGGYAATLDSRATPEDDGLLPRPPPPPTAIIWESSRKLDKIKNNYATISAEKLINLK